MTAFLTALIYVFLAEMGDKTQLMTLGFAARYNHWIVLSGVFVATALINLLSVGLGVEIGDRLPVFWINNLAGLAFIAFGIWELRPEKEDESALEKKTKLGPFLTIVIAFFFAELGDKTMLAAVAIASKQPRFLEVWLGSTVGLVASNALAIFAGHFVRERLSAGFLKVAIAAVYIISGLAALAQAWLPRLI